MKKLLILLLGAILIGILSYFCFMDKSDDIKHDLLTQAGSAYGASKMDWVKSGVKGDDLELTRILTLDGTAPSEDLKAEAEKIALGLDGVDGVDNRLIVQQVANVENILKEEPEVETPVVEPIVVAEKTPVPSPYEIHVSKSEDEKILLSGYVPNADVHTSLVDKAIALFGKEQVIDELKEHEGAPQKWAKSAMLGLDKLDVVSYGKFKIVDNNFTFEGHVSALDKKETLLQSFNETLDSSYSGSYDIDAPAVVVEKPVPTPEPVFSCQEAFKGTLEGQKINFEYNKATIKEDSYNLLDSIVEVAKKCPQDAIEVAGHTDSIGSANYNQRLSKSRALAVKSYLAEKGISEDRLKAVGYGEMKPIADNKMEEGRAENRRIEFNIIDIKDAQVIEEPTVDSRIGDELNVKEEDFKNIPLAKLIKLDETVPQQEKRVAEKNTLPTTSTEVIEKPIVQSVWKRAYSCQEQFRDALAKDKIQFANNKAEIRTDSYTILNYLSQLARSCDNKIIYIGGHTDSTGDSGHNKRLSQNRAEAIKEYFIKRGVSSDRLIAVGYGETRPIADNKTRSGKAKNRRIEFYVKGVE